MTRRNWLKSLAGGVTALCGLAAKRQPATRWVVTMASTTLTPEEVAKIKAEWEAMCRGAVRAVDAAPAVVIRDCTVTYTA
jgi:hypothetical protein